MTLMFIPFEVRRTNRRARAAVVTASVSGGVKTLPGSPGLTAKGETLSDSGTYPFAPSFVDGLPGVFTRSGVAAEMAGAVKSLVSQAENPVRGDRGLETLEVQRAQSLDVNECFVTREHAL